MKKLMKITSFVLGLGLFLFPISVISQTLVTVPGGGNVQRPDCPILEDGTIGPITLTDETLPFENRCVNDLKSLKVSFVELGICTSAPNEENPLLDMRDKCVMLLTDYISPRLVSFGLGGVPPKIALDEVYVPPGNYTHAVFVTENKWYFKSQQRFSDLLQGRSNAGKICYTIAGATYNKFSTTSLADLSVDCVEDEADIAANGNYGWMANETFYLGSGDPVKTMLSGNKLFLLSSSQDLAVIDAPNRTSDAAYELGLNYMTTDLVVPENGTLTVDFGFAMSDFGRVEFSTIGPCAENSRSAGTVGCLNALKTNDFDFSVSGR
jgi:hypothetical protein